jgi:hypothetical protein
VRAIEGQLARTIQMMRGRLNADKIERQFLRASRGDGGFTRGRNDPSAASGSTEPASGGGSGALLV